MTSDSKTIPCSEPPESSPLDMTERELLLRIYTRISTLERGFVEVCKRNTDLALDVIPRVERLEEDVKELRAKITVLECTTPDCPLRKTA